MKLNPRDNLNKGRLSALVDAIFAIIMTILVLELKIPEFASVTAGSELWALIDEIKISFLAFIFSFILLFTYWRSHHFIITAYAKNIDFNLTSINAIFLILIALVPFSTHLVGVYSDLFLAIALYGLNIILIGLVLMWMKRYVVRSERINSQLTHNDLVHGDARILFPVYASIIAILLALIDTKLSLGIFTLVIIFNMIPGSSRFLVHGLKEEDI